MGGGGTFGEHSTDNALQTQITTIIIIIMNYSHLILEL